MKKHSTVTQSSKQGKKPSKTRRERITIGLDLGDKTSRCCALGENGEVVFERSVTTSNKGMSQVFGALARCRIALEVGTHSPWISRLLTSWGHEVIVANARQVKLITQSTRKDDKLDAHTLAAVARKLGILLHRLWVTGEAYEPLRHSAAAAKAKQQAA